jgi:hypothetical protein
MKRESGEKRLREKKSRTGCGIKPIGKVQWNFKAYYLYGAIAPQTGESFGPLFSHLDSLCFQIFLDKLAAEYPEHLNVIQLDNGRFHLSSKLKIPEKVLLIFQPPYSPELNPLLTSIALYKTRTELGNL